MFDLNGDKPLPRCWHKPPDLAARSATVALPVRRLGSFENADKGVPRLIIAAARQEESAWDAEMPCRRSAAVTAWLDRPVSAAMALIVRCWLRCRSVR